MRLSMPGFGGRFPRHPSAWFWRAAALQANQRGLEAARACHHWRNARRQMIRSAWARGSVWPPCLSISNAVRKLAPCGENIFTPQAEARWRDAKGFPALKGLAKNHGPLLRLSKFLMAEMAHAGKQHGEPGRIGGGNHFIVTNGTARLDNCRGPRFRGAQQAVGKWEKRI